MQNRHKISGFSLIEMMVAIIILAILAAFALPLYQSHIEKGHLADAKQDLTSLRQAFENNRLARPRDFMTDAQYQAEFNIAATRALSNESKKFYNFTETIVKTNNVPTGFTVIAVPNSSTAKKYKFGLQMDISGNVLRCKVSGGNIVKSSCEKF